MTVASASAFGTVRDFLFGAPRSVTSGAPVWSPDGRRIAFLSTTCLPGRPPCAGRAQDRHRQAWRARPARARSGGAAKRLGGVAACPVSRLAKSRARTRSRRFYHTYPDGTSWHYSDLVVTNVDEAGDGLSLRGASTRILSGRQTAARSPSFASVATMPTSTSSMPTEPAGASSPTPSPSRPPDGNPEVRTRTPRGRPTDGGSRSRAAVTGTRTSTSSTSTAAGSSTSRGAVAPTAGPCGRRMGGRSPFGATATATARSTS